LDRLGVPGGRHGDRHREDGPESVDDIEPEECRDPQAMPSTASRCRRLISAGSVTKSSDPTSPRPSAASTSADGECGVSLSAGGKSGGGLAVGAAPCGEWQD